MDETISREELEQIVDSAVQRRIIKAIEEFFRVNEQRAKELSLMERIVRVEEELKALREIEIARFEASERRFESLQREIDNRFETLQEEMLVRFDASDKRFEALQREMVARFEASEKRFEALQREINTRSEVTEKRFESLQKEISARFEALEKRLLFVQWFIGIGFTVVTLLLTVFKFRS